jgi:glycosyltransferase involved in cell wall biosynthesis
VCDPLRGNEAGLTAPPVVMLGPGWFAAQRTGLNRYFFDLLHAWPAGAARAVVVGPAPGAPAGVWTAGEHGDRLGLRLWRFARAAGGAADDACLVDGHFAMYTAAALTRRSIRSLPLVVHFQGPWAAESASSRTSSSTGIAAKRALERFVYRRAAAIVVLSSRFSRVLVEEYGVDPARVHVITPGVDLVRFQPGDRGAARQELNLSPDSFVVAAARRLVPRMGLDVLIRAWAEIDPSCDAVLLVAGTGPEAERLRELAMELRLEERVRFLGEVPESLLVTLYQAADLTVVPSRELEGFGLVVLESWACATPVIGSDVGGLGEAIAAFDRRLLVPPGDSSELASLLRTMIADPSRLPAPATCRAAAEAHAWGTVVDAHARLYADVVNPPAERRPRVVYLDHTAQLSGAELSLARLLPALDRVRAHVILAADGPLVGLLARQGCSTEVLAMPEGPRRLSRDAVTLRRLPLRAGASTAAYVWRLARRVRRLAPDVIHTNSLKAALYGGLTGRLLGIPVVWQINDRISDDYLPRQAVRLMRSAATRLPDHIIVNSHATAATLPVLRPVTIIPHVVPPQAMAPARAARDQGPLRVGLVGRLSPWKGQDIFIRAFAIAFAGTDAVALIVGGALFGEDHIETGLRSLAEDLGIADQVHLLGHRDDVHDVMSGLDVVVHASTIPEPFGMVIGEAMALGVPVVAANAGGPAEIIEHGVNGLLYRMGDPGELAGALRVLADDPALRQRLASAGRATARAFTPELVARAVEGVYAELLRGRPARSRRRRRARRSRGWASRAAR